MNSLTRMILMIICLPLFVEVWFYMFRLNFLSLYGEQTLENMAKSNKLIARLWSTIGEVGETMQFNTKATEPIRYIPISQREDCEKPVTFIMKPLDFFQLSKLKDRQFEISSRGKVTNIRTISMRVEIAFNQLNGWEGAEDEDGKPIVFPKNPTVAIRKEMYGLIPSEVQDELMTVFGDGKYDAEAEAKLIELRNSSDEDEAAEDEDDAEVLYDVDAEDVEEVA